METTIKLTHFTHHAELTLCPPEGKPPTLDHDTLDNIESVLNDLMAQETLPRCLVLQSVSPKYFCVGANLNVLRETNEETIVPWVMKGHRILNRIEDLPFPVVAKVAGYALGGGLELAMAADLIYATEQAQFGQPEAKLGFVPGWGGTRRLAERIGLPGAKEWFYTGRIYSAADASALGLIQQLTEDVDSLNKSVAAFVEDTQSCSSVAVEQVKGLLGRTDKTRNTSRESNATKEAFASIHCIRSVDTKNRLEKFFSGRK